jgi:hypothetical protein
MATNQVSRPFYFDEIILSGLVSTDQPDLQFIFLQLAQNDRAPTDLLKNEWMRVKATEIHNLDRTRTIDKVWSEMNMEQKIALVEALLRFRSHLSLPIVQLVARMERSLGVGWSQLLRKALDFNAITYDNLAKNWFLARAKEVVSRGFNPQFITMAMFYLGEEPVTRFLNLTTAEANFLPILLHLE